MVIKLIKIKRSASKLRLKKYRFYKKDTLLYNLILYIKSFTFTNLAFKDLNNPKQIYNLIIPLSFNYIIIP